MLACIIVTASYMVVSAAVNFMFVSFDMPSTCNYYYGCVASMYELVGSGMLV